MESNVINKSDSRYTRMIPDRIGRQEVLLQINHNHYNFWEKKTNAFFFFFVKELLKPIILN